jgi:hypothetical protein
LEKNRGERFPKNNIFFKLQQLSFIFGQRLLDAQPNRIYPSEKMALTTNKKGGDFSIEYRLSGRNKPIVVFSAETPNLNLYTAIITSGNQRPVFFTVKYNNQVYYDLDSFISENISYKFKKEINGVYKNFSKLISKSVF